MQIALGPQQVSIPGSGTPIPGQITVQMSAQPPAPIQQQQPPPPIIPPQSSVSSSFFQVNVRHHLFVVMGIFNGGGYLVAVGFGVSKALFFELLL